MKRVRRSGVVAVTAALLAAGSLAACGGSGGGSDSAQVTATVKSFLSGLADGNGSTACGALTPAARERFVEEGASSGLQTCSALVKLVGSEFTAVEKRKLEHATVIDVKVDGDSATARIKDGKGQPQLTKTHGRWLISGGLGS